MPIRVLFIHGLESDHRGSKVVAMKNANFDVYAVDMHMSAKRIDKKNSMVRNIFRTQSFFYWILLTVGMLGIAYFRHLTWQHILMLFVGGNIFLYFWRKNLFAEAWKLSIASSIALQKQAIEDFSPDVIVGSSYGGAITAELIRRDIWKGPTILLAPAYIKVLEFGRIEEKDEHVKSIRTKSQTQPIVVIHDRSDDVVPYGDSVELASNSKITLISPTDGGGHRLLKILEDGTLFEEIKNIVS